MNLFLPVIPLVVWLPLHAYSQGNFVFDNFIDTAAGAPVTISAVPGTFNPANGPAGAYIGSDYTASLFFLNGTVTAPAVFDSSSPVFFPSADTQFFGTTGFNADGSGFFEGGIVYLAPASGIYVTVQIRAWYRGNGLYTSYAQALAAGQNVGESNPVAVQLAVGLANPPPLVGLLPFTVGVVPEPSTFLLVGLGGLGLLLFRPRN